MTIRTMGMMWTIPITIPMTTVNMMRRLRKLMDLNLMKKLNKLQALLVLAKNKANTLQVLAQNKANPEGRAL